MGDSGKRAIVTGGFGFIGSHIVDQLLAAGHEVWVIDNLATGRESNLPDEKDHDRLHVCRMKNGKLYDIRWTEEMERLFGEIRPQWVFHTAALARIQPSIDNPIEYNAVNVKGTLNLLEAARKCGTVEAFVYSSSSSCYGDRGDMPLRESDDTNPMSPYALQKLAGEAYCLLYGELHGMRVRALRYFNVWGARQVPEGDYAAVVGIFLTQKAKGEPLTLVGDGSQKRDFTHVDDVARANLQAAVAETHYKVFNVGRGSNVSIAELADAIDPGGERVNLPKRRGDARETLADSQRAREALGWVPETDILEWARAEAERGRERPKSST